MLDPVHFGSAFLLDKYILWFVPCWSIPPIYMEHEQLFNQTQAQIVHVWIKKYYGIVTRNID